MPHVLSLSGNLLMYSQPLETIFVGAGSLVEIAVDAMSQRV